jgi:hypothetical protein
VTRVAVLAGLAAFALSCAGFIFDQPRPHGSELQHYVPPRAVGPTPPFGGAVSARSHGCPRETLVRFSAFESWLHELPLGAVLGAVAARELTGSCARAGL